MAKHYMRKIVEAPLNLIDIDKLKDLRKQQSKIKDIIHRVKLSMPVIYYLNRRFKHDS